MILVGKDGRPSMKAVYQHMKFNCELRIRRKIKNKEWFRSFNYNVSDYFIKKSINAPFNENVIIRWGNRIPLPVNNNSIVYNNIKALEKINNKGLTRQILKNNNILTPYYTYEKISEDSNLEYPIICRPLQHAKGRNFIVLNNSNELNHFLDLNEMTNFYFAPYLEKDAEFRVHCGLGKVISVLEKPKPSNPSQKAWNRSLNGDPFIYIPWSEYNYDMCITALKAMEAVGADFGAVDIIRFEDKYYVLEINSSPTLISNDYTVQRYAKLFDYIHRHTKTSKLEHWDFKKFKNSKSLAWKNFQLDSDINIINQNDRDN